MREKEKLEYTVQCREGCTRGQMLCVHRCLAAAARIKAATAGQKEGPGDHCAMCISRAGLVPSAARLESPLCHHAAISSVAFATSGATAAAMHAASSSCPCGGGAASWVTTELAPLVLAWPGWPSSPPAHTPRAFAVCMVKLGWCPAT